MNVRELSKDLSENKYTQQEIAARIKKFLHEEKAKTCNAMLAYKKIYGDCGVLAECRFEVHDEQSRRPLDFFMKEFEDLANNSMSFKDPKPSSEFRRISLNVRSDLLDSLAREAELSGDNRTTVIHDALGLYFILKSEYRNGSRIIIERRGFGKLEVLIK